MKWEHNFNILVGTSSYPKELDYLKDIIIFSVSLVVVQLHLIEGNKFWNACFKEKESLF